MAQKLFRNIKQAENEKDNFAKNFESSSHINMEQAVTKYSFQDISEMHNIENQTYEVKISVQKKRFYQFKVTPLDMDDLKIVQIIDITHQILYSES